MADRPAIRLLVCGNVERGDDGAAVAATSGLLADLPARVVDILDVRTCDRVEVEDILDAPRSMAFVIADTIVGIPVGSVAVLPLCDLPEDAGIQGPAARSTHILPIGQVMAMAEILRDRPVDGVLVGLGGASFDVGRRLGAQVERALPGFRAAIGSAILELADRVAPTESVATGGA